LVYTTGELPTRPFDATRFLTPSPHQNRCRRPRVEKVGLGSRPSEPRRFGPTVRWNHSRLPLWLTLQQWLPPKTLSAEGRGSSEAPDRRRLGNLRQRRRRPPQRHCMSPQNVSARNKPTAASRALRSIEAVSAYPARQFVLTHHNGQHGFAGRASLAQHAGTLGCRHRHWRCPMNIEIRYGTMKLDSFQNR
jgi:hypothetical protein